MCVCVWGGGGFALLIYLFFSQISHINFGLAEAKKSFSFIEYLKMGGGEGVQANPLWTKPSVRYPHQPQVNKIKIWEECSSK